MMKKSILSLSAAVALSGLGFAVGANAAIVTTQDTGADATGTADRLAINPAGTGHVLFTPYYSAQGTNATFITIVNTDSDNGKAVKMRMRGAGNSDDVLDFTIFMSAGDVWTGMIRQSESGLPEISTPDDTCTAPAFNGPQPFDTERLRGNVPDPNAATREGYIEVINMADIDPLSALYGLIEHPDSPNAVAANGDPRYVPTCYSGNTLLNDLATNLTPSNGSAYGLIAPTGQLFGDWTIANLSDLGTYSGDMTAVAATDRGLSRNGVARNVGAAVNYFPQRKLPLPNFISIGNYSADPAFTPSGALDPLVFDLPDASTPVIFGQSPNQQVNQLRRSLEKDVIMNEWIATAPGADVPYSTDWVISQPIRRYYTNYDYADAKIVDNPGGSGLGPNPYRNRVLCETANGPQVGMDWTAALTNREEANVRTTSQPEWSPGNVSAPLAFCGEVSLLAFGENSVLHGSQTLQNVSNFSTGVPPGGAGWGSLQINGTPVIGYAAAEFKLGSGTNFGQTFPHRWRNALDHDPEEGVGPAGDGLNPNWGQKDEDEGGLG